MLAVLSDDLRVVAVDLAETCQRYLCGMAEPEEVVKTADLLTHLLAFVGPPREPAGCGDGAPILNRPRVRWAQCPPPRPF